MRLPYLRIAATGTLAGLFIFLWLFAAPQRRADAAGYEGSTQDGKPFVFNSVLTSGKKAGELVLGSTTFDEVLKMFPDPPFTDYDGALRPVDGLLPEGYPAAKFVYNPWQTMYALFFDEHKKLVMVSELHELGRLTEKELLKRFPGLVEANSAEDSVDYHAEIHECVSVIATVETKGRTVEQLSYAYACE